MRIKNRIAIAFTAALMLTCFTCEAKAGQKAVKLSEDVINYTALRDETRQIPFEKLGGIYFLNYNKLVFYNTTTGESEEVYDFISVGDSYVSGNKLYTINATDTWIPPKNTTITVFDLSKKEVVRTIELDILADAIGADSSGRIYIAKSGNKKSTIYLLSPEGKQLSTTTSETEVYEFGGFNKSNGIFYVLAYQNMVSWGYSHDMKGLVAGKVEDNKISIGKSSYTYVCQQYFYERQNQLEMQSGGYLFVDNTYINRLEVYNTKTCVVDKKLKQVMSISRTNITDGNFSRIAAIGTRAVYKSDIDSVIAFKDGKNICEYRMKDGKEVHLAEAEHTPLSMFLYNGGIAVIEKEGSDFYYEYFSWNPATKLSIKSNTSSVKRGGTLKLTATNNGDLQENYQWKSSNPKIASVNQSGEVYGWSKGQVTITVTTESGLTAKKQIRVSKEMSVNDPKYSKVNMSGTSTSNAGKNNYNIWSSTVNSYLMQNADGTISRVEYINNKVIVETYSSTGKYQKKKSIKMELPVFGGFYSGKKYNFIVFGQGNPKENDKKEVVRVVKYSKNWKRLSAVSVKGANTYNPFDAGSLRMTETGNRLYVYTCHTMYNTGDGYHHQANMIFEIDEQKMKVKQSYSDVLNIAQAGYVSHSFNQFIQTDGTYVYRVDHGDYYPRGISIVRSNVAGSITDVNYTVPISLTNVEGYNPTGASVGGFELSTGKCIIAGNSVDYNNTTDPNGKRNIFVSITSKGLSGSKVIWLTKYTSSSKYGVGTPQMIKIGNCQFLVMWEEYSATKTRTKMVTIDDDGNMTSKIVSTDARLSDCQPIRCKDGRVRWYAGNGGKPVLYTVNPINLK